MAAQLTDILEYTALASGELLPGQGGDGRSSERGLGIRLEALDLVAGHDVLPVLESWERMFREEWGYAPWGPTTFARGRGQADQPLAYMTGTVAFLRGNLEKICGHVAVDDFASEVQHAYYKARAAARRQPPQVYRVQCPASVGESDCGHSLRFTAIDIQDDVRCESCGTLWTVQRLVLVAEAAGKSIWVDLEAAATYFAIHPTTIRKWHKDGHVNRRGHQYDLQTIRAHIEFTKQIACDLASIART
jgi:hypothetical protein